MNKTRLAALLLPLILSAACVPGGGGGFNLKNTTSSQAANNQANQNTYQPVDYANSHIRGPLVVVLPGKIKSNNATFKQKVTANNIADYGELELGNANFRVLERSDLGPLLNEVKLAVGMGNPSALKQFKRGRFKSTKYFVRFDILKAEQVATAKSGFDGRAFGSIARSLINNGRTGSIANTIGSSTQTSNSSGIWIIGMRYKVIDVNTTEQINTGYFEDKMEVGAKAVSVLGMSQSQTGGVTLDTMVQKLVQKAVAKIDRVGK
jgi:hypothetical protein